MLKLFYITNDPNVALVAEECGVERIFVDMEYLGKEERQPKMNTVKSNHKIEDVKALRAVLTKAELLVRVNPINPNSEKEINEVIDAGADVIMLPMWKTADDVKTFFNYVNGRVKTILLLENEDARNSLDEVLKLSGIDEIHIGLNDLHLSQGKKFLFEPLVDGTVDEIAKKLRINNVTFGIGGIGAVSVDAPLPAKKIIAEHYRLGSTMAILSRAFCNTNNYNNLEALKADFSKRLKENRNFEKSLENKGAEYFEENRKITKQIVKRIVG